MAPLGELPSGESDATPDVDLDVLGQSILSDTPADADSDALDYRTYAEALASTIGRLDQQPTPITIAIYGAWGSGKSSLMNILEKILPYKTIRVSVWNFANEEEVWKAFLQSLLLKVREKMRWTQRIVFHAKLLWHRLNWAESLKLLCGIATAVVPVYLTLWVAQEPGQKVAGWAGIIVGPLVGWYWFLRPYISSVQERAKVDLAKLVGTSPLKERVSLIDEFKPYFKDMITSLAGRNGRVVVLVDDLDRCPQDRIMQVLDAIKLFLDIPNCVYILGLDRDIVEQAVRTRFSEYKDKDDLSEAKDYLEKMVTLPFELPQLTRVSMIKLIEKAIEKREDVGGGEIEKEQENDSLRRRIIEVLARGQEANPRKVKRTVNMFLLLSAISLQREELKGRIKPIRLAKIVVIQHSYRNFFKELRKTPGILGYLEIEFRKLQKKPKEESKEEKKESKEKPKERDDIADSTSGSELVNPFSEQIEPFVHDESLRYLLMLHKEVSDASFSEKVKGTFTPISDIQDYVRLTQSVVSELGEGETKTARMREAEPGTASTEEAAPETTLTREAEIEAALPKRLQEIFKNHRIWQHTDGHKGSMANLKGEKLQGTRLNGLNLMWANLSEADLSGSDLSDSDLFGANLSHAILKSTLLDWAVLIKAKLIQAKLQESSLRGANLSEADLSGADLTGANLTDAKVSDSQLELAITDNKTILPNGSQGPARKNRKD
jgi:energy-coupling factor transporter ATP-binding protein EcfA2